MQKITLLTAVWNRRKNLDEFLNRWLVQPEIDEIIIWDNSGCLLKEDHPILSDPRIVVVSSTKNYSGQARCVMAQWAKNDIVIISDDDCMVEPGFVAEMAKYYTDDNCYIGIWGKFFGQDYQSSFNPENTVRGDRIDKPIEVTALVGLIYMIHRQWVYPIDYRDLKWCCYDIEVSGIYKHDYPWIKKIVVPNKLWRLTDEESDITALNRHPDAAKEKQEVFERYFK